MEPPHGGGYSAASANWKMYDGTNLAGKHDVVSATDAAQALRPLAGDASALLLAVGLIGAGVVAGPADAP